MFKNERELPTPEFVILCSRKHEWKTHALLIAAHGRPMLLVGSCDDRQFIDSLKDKHGMSCEVERSDEAILLWNPEKIGVPCPELAGHPQLWPVDGPVPQP